MSASGFTSTLTDWRANTPQIKSSTALTRVKGRGYDADVVEELKHLVVCFYRRLEKT